MSIGTCFFAVILISVSSTGFAKPTPGDPKVAEAGSETPGSIDINRQMQDLISTLARCVVPHNYQNEKKWGLTKEIVTGLYVKRDGLRIKTHRTRKAVNHGTWTRYEIRLIDPDQLFRVQLENVQQLPNGNVAFDVVCQASLRTLGRLAQWQRGVQLISINAEADADVQLTMKCHLGSNFSISDQVVQTADLKIKSFQLRRISQLHGPLVRQLSGGIQKVLEDEVEKRRVKLVDRINKQLNKNRAKMHESMRKWLLSQWGDFRSLLTKE